MTPDQIKNAMAKWDTFSDEEKHLAKTDILERLSRVDNLATLSDEAAEKLNGGVNPGKKLIDIIFGIILPDPNPFPNQILKSSANL